MTGGLFDPDEFYRPHSEAERRRNEAMRVVDRNANPEWKDVALDAVREIALIRGKDGFTTDAVWALLTRWGWQDATHEPRALGPVMTRAVKLGICRPTERFGRSTIPRGHARPVRIYIGTLGVTHDN